MSNIDFGTWLSAISLGELNDVPRDYLILMVQRGYCSLEGSIQIWNIPDELLFCCHSNLNRPLDPQSPQALLRLNNTPPPTERPTR